MVNISKLFGIRMLHSYRNIAKFLEVCGQGNVLTVHVQTFCSSTLRELDLPQDKNGCGKSLDQPVCAILECSCL